MTPAFTEAIITGETNHRRFERFCLDICEQTEKVAFVPTSVTYDQGRDARALGRSRGSHAAVVCSTLDESIDEKIHNDLKRVAATTKPDRLIYCYSQKLSEYRIDKLTAAIRRLVNPDCSITILAALHLTHLAEQHPDILQKHYAAELRTIESNLLAFHAGKETTETKGLRLALIVFGSEDATALRRTISRRAILEVMLQYPEGAAEAQIARRLSDDLRLPRVLDLQYIRSILGELRATDAATEDRGTWTITPQGRTESESVPIEAAESLLRGRAIIRQALEQLTGRHLDDKQFEPIWSTLVDFLSDLFYSNGVAIITAINEFLSVIEPTGEPSDLETLIQQGANRIGATFAIPEMGTEYEQAIKDIFTERSGAAFEWLARICERFIALCALGLETSSATEILGALRRYQLVLDSDVVLTILGQGEPDHQALREILARFRLIGGKVLVSAPVLEEVAYHAHISIKDFNKCLPLFGKLRPEEIPRYTENAFVRAFFTVSSAPKHWQAYIGQFTGTSRRDYSKILQSLEDELMVGILPATHDANLARNITNYLREVAGHSGTPPEDLYASSDIGKTGRDGQLLASIATARNAARSAGTPAHILLLSSSSRLRKADRRFRKELDLPEAVISRHALSYMLALVPDTALGAGALRQALFDFGRTAHLTDVDRFALRIMRASEQFDLPWAKRRLFEAELDKVIRREANRQDISEATLRKEVAAGEKPSPADDIIITAVRNMALRDTTTEELNQAQSRIRQLEGQLEDLRKYIQQAADDSSESAQT